MDYLTTHALVLRAAQYGESSRMLTVLTAENGRLSVSARGALRKNSRVAAAVQPLVFSEMTLSVSRDRYTLTEAHVVEQFRGLTEDLPAFALGAYVAELLETVADTDAPSPDLLSLGLNALFALADVKRPRELVKAATELRLMCVSGFAPDLSSCGSCGGTENLAHLDLGGGLLCNDCVRSSGAETAEIDEPALSALRYVSSADAKRLYAFKLDDARLFASACEQYALAQLGCGFKTLEYYRKVAL